MSEPASVPAWKIGEMPLHHLLAAGRRVARDACARTVRLAVLGDAATQHYSQALSAALKLRGWWPEIYEAEFDTIRQEAIDPGSGLYQHRPQFVVLFTVVQALAARFAAAGDKTGFEEAYLDQLVQLWDHIGRLARTTIIQHNFALPIERPYGNQTLTSRSTFLEAAWRLNTRLTEAASKKGVRLVDTEFQASYFGKRHWFDERLWCQARQALSPAFMPALAKTVSDTILADLGVGVKCVVVDLDNTLWGGILGEDGPDRLELGQTEVGLVFRRFQLALNELRDRGILLAVCSKNDEQLVLDVLDTHPDMVLRRQSFVVIAANYLDKVTNLMAIRERLNIGFDSLLFLDDSPFEREMVRRALPDVQTPDLPSDPAEFLNALARWSLFEGRIATSEDRQRETYYQTDRLRQTLQSQYADLDQYLADLEMVAESRPFDGYTMPRVVQLVQRSNQFNLTTIRYAEAELADLARNPAAAAFCIRLADRLGDNGIVVAVVLKKVAADCVVDTWIMSCRVLGRRLEELTVRLMTERARALGCRRLLGRFTPTSKNELVADLYTRLGFTPAGMDGETRFFELDIPSYTSQPLPITVRDLELKENP